MNGHHDKVTTAHLRKGAYLYIRQSTLQQVLENTESTRRQYELKRRAIALGWSEESIVVIDSDLGQSGASAKDRAGFQQLVAEVGIGRAGIVMGLEVSRLARNSADWHRLLELCALSDTLILDEDGIYDPAHFNDRLLLGLKGTMSEAELHMLRARMQGGYMAKARRGELRLRLPIGLVYDATDKVQFDPDRQVQQVMRAIFETFRRLGSAGRTAIALADDGLRLPHRPLHGPHRGELLWKDVSYSRILAILHNPRYAGAYALGQTRQRKHDGVRKTVRRRNPEDWDVLLRDLHPGYIDWDEFEENQRRLYQNNCRTRGTKGTTPPRDGPALLQGIMLCGVCGKRMGVRYYHRGGRALPYYFCRREHLRRSDERCQDIPGRNIDEAVAQLVLETMTPVALEVALAVHDELQRRADQVDKLRKEHVERARYEAEAAQRRYLRVDPDNRLVADELEHNWNEKLRALSQAQDEYDRQRPKDTAALGDEQRNRIASLATNFPAVWSAPTTANRDKKRMLRHVIEDVTVIKGDTVTVHMRFRGGATQSLSLPRTLQSWKTWTTPPETVKEIDKLLEHHTYAEIAELLNERGFASGHGRPFRGKIISNIRRKYGLATRWDRLRKRGLVSADELAHKIGVASPTILRWRARGLITAVVYDDHGRCLYDPTAAMPQPWSSTASRKRSPRTNATQTTKGGAV